MVGTAEGVLKRWVGVKFCEDRKHDDRLEKVRRRGFSWLVRREEEEAKKWRVRFESNCSPRPRDSESLAR